MNYETDRVIKYLKAMKERPGMYLFGNSGSVLALIHFMHGLDIGCDVHMGFERKLALKCRTGAVNANNDDISIEDAIQFAIDLIKEHGIPTPSERAMEEALK